MNKFRLFRLFIANYYYKHAVLSNVRNKLNEYNVENLEKIIHIIIYDNIDNSTKFTNLINDFTTRFDAELKSYNPLSSKYFIRYNEIMAELSRYLCFKYRLKININFTKEQILEMDKKFKIEKRIETMNRDFN